MRILDHEARCPPVRLACSAQYGRLQPNQPGTRRTKFRQKGFAPGTRALLKAPSHRIVWHARNHSRDGQMVHSTLHLQAAQLVMREQEQWIDADGEMWEVICLCARSNFLQSGTPRFDFLPARSCQRQMLLCGKCFSPTAMMAKDACANTTGGGRIQIHCRSTMRSTGYVDLQISSKRRADGTFRRTSICTADVTGGQTCLERASYPEANEDSLLS
jgi:hypothetical protein